MALKTNIVSQEKVREAQLNALKIMADTIAASFGPMGSNTLILKDGQQNKYSKDGFTILKEMKFLGTIEEAMRQDVEDMLRNVVKEFGDNSTSVTILCYLIFKELVENESIQYQNPYDKIRYFKRAVEKITARIEEHKRPCTINDIYNIAYTATNGNRDLAKRMRVLYEKYGMDVFIDIELSNTEDFIVKELDGVTLDAGYMDPCFINNKAKNNCLINDAHVYYFEDPIDTEEMGGFFDTIIGRNIIQPINDKQAPIPTVILCPKISRDYSTVIKEVVEWMYQSGIDHRPPLLIVTNIYDKSILSDITMLCGCKSIKKYIDPKNQEADIARGLAPDNVTITEFYGHCVQVESDMGHTKFINPDKMINPDGTPGSAYTALVQFLENEIVRQKESGTQGTTEVALLKRRLHALKSNMILLYVGGISPAERDSFRDLLEDAILSCRSAAKYGCGYGANFEGLRASLEEYMHQSGCDVPKGMARLTDPGDDYYHVQIIMHAYEKVTTQLYTTVYPEEKAEGLMKKSIEQDRPFNLRTKEFDGLVLTSIRSDIQALDVIGRLLTIMYTCNQALLQNPVVNIYE